MAYTAQVNSETPACIVLLVDQSRSMDQLFGGKTAHGYAKKKKDAVAEAVNGLLRTVIASSRRGAEVKNYFQVSVIGYGQRVGSAFKGPLEGATHVSVQELFAHPWRREEVTEREVDAGRLYEWTSVVDTYIDPVANGGTPMGTALVQADRIVESWLTAHARSYPPVVFNVTDGEADNGDDPFSPAMAIQGHAGEDGAALLFNIHISSTTERPVLFPDDDVKLPDDYSQLLYSMSSPLPDEVRERARGLHYHINDNARGFAYHAEMTDLFQFFNLGTPRPQ